MRPYALLLSTTLLLGGCASLLPSGQIDPQVRWENYDEIVGQFSAIEVGKTTDLELKQMGLHPQALANVTILGYADVMNRFSPGGLQHTDHLDPGIRTCLLARQACTAYRIDLMRESRQRTGNFLLDFMGFKRVSDFRGWRFTGMVVLVNDRVVYKESGGTPAISRQETSVNPLGPLQGIGESLRY